MKTRNEVILWTGIALAAAAFPFAVRMLFVEGPAERRTRVEFDERVAARQEELEALRDVLEVIVADPDPSIERQRKLRAQWAETVRELRVARSDVASRREEFARDERRLHEEETTNDVLRTELDDLTARAAQVERTAAELDRDVETLARDLEALETEERIVVDETRRLAQQRRSWEDDLTWNSLPRVAVRGVVGRGDEFAWSGLESSFWIARPWSQRIGVKSALLVEHRTRRTERMVLAPSWQQRLGRRSHVDLWAGPLLHAEAGTMEVDPAVGATFGWSLAQWPISVGLTGFASDGGGMVGVGVGYSQEGQAIDPYGAR